MHLQAACAIFRHAAASYVTAILLPLRHQFVVDSAMSRRKLKLRRHP
jgi:hypothetical protein